MDDSVAVKEFLYLFVGLRTCELRPRGAGSGSYTGSAAKEIFEGPHGNLILILSCNTLSFVDQER